MARKAGHWDGRDSTPTCRGCGGAAVAWPGRAGERPSVSRTRAEVHPGSRTNSSDTGAGCGGVGPSLDPTALWLGNEEGGDSPAAPAHPPRPRRGGRAETAPISQVEKVRVGWKTLRGASRSPAPREHGSYLGPPAAVGDRGLAAAHTLPVVEVGEGPLGAPGLEVAGHAQGGPHLQGRVPLGLGEVLAGWGRLLALRGEGGDTEPLVPPS